MQRILGGTRGRLTTVAVAVLAAAVLVADVALYGSVVTTGTRESDVGLAAQAGGLISGLTRSNGQLAFGPNAVPGETPSGVTIRAALVRPGGSVLDPAPGPLPVATLVGLADKARAAHHPVWATVLAPDQTVRRVYAAPLSGSSAGTILVLSRSLSELQASEHRALLSLVLISLVVVLLGGGLTYWQAGRILRPVRMIAATARSLSERDLHRRVEIRVPSDEMGELVETFNAMLARLEAAFDSLRRFTADASHELRAPLTVMRTEIEVALAGARAGNETQQMLRTLQLEVEHLAHVAEQLLILARADAGALQPALEPVDVADFLHLIAARWSAPAERRAVRLEVEAPDSGVVATDPALTRRVLDNLIENAIRHTRPGGRVWIRARQGVGAWTFEVADEGPGVPLELRDRLFTRFARADSARTRYGGGAGLGLALSASIARAHGGDLQLVPTSVAGATFRLTLPGGTGAGGETTRSPGRTGSLTPPSAR